MSRDEHEPARQPRTARQRAASRANGAKSRGPKTEAGKGVSSQNARKHGVFGAAAKAEDRVARYEAHRGWLTAEYEPTTGVDEMLVDRAARQLAYLDRLDADAGVGPSAAAEAAAGTRRADLDRLAELLREWDRAFIDGRHEAAVPARADEVVDLMRRTEVVDEEDVEALRRIADEEDAQGDLQSDLQGELGEWLEAVEGAIDALDAAPRAPLSDAALATIGRERRHTEKRVLEIIDRLERGRGGAAGVRFGAAAL